MSQNAKVLDWLRKWGSITPKEAIDNLRIYRLGARVYDLRKRGHDILNANPQGFGDHARYVLIKEAGA